MIILAVNSRWRREWQMIELKVSAMFEYTNQQKINTRFYNSMKPYSARKKNRTKHGVLNAVIILLNNYN